MLADLLAGKPVTIPAWKLRGRTFGEAARRIPWLARDVVAYADDVVMPPEGPADQGHRGTPAIGRLSQKS